MSYPHWLGLLKWSLGHSDGTSESEFSEMTAEDKKWLEKVMEEMVKDEPKRMSEILKIFSEILERGVKSSDESEVEGMLDEIHSIIDQVDMADIFIRFGGIKALSGFLRAPELSDDIKCQVCVVYGELAQNNLPVQEAFLTHGVVDELCVLAAAHNNPKVSAKCIYAVSCAIRGFAPAENRFCNELTGALFLYRLLEKADVAVSRRVFFLGAALLTSDSSSPERTAELVQRLVAPAISALSAEDMEVRDNALHFLSATALSAEGRAVLRVHQQTPAASSTDSSLSPLDQALATRKDVVANSLAADLASGGELASFATETQLEEDDRVARFLSVLQRGGEEDAAETAPKTSSQQLQSDAYTSTSSESRNTVAMISNA